MDETTLDLVIENLTSIRHGLLEVVKQNEQTAKEIREGLKELQKTLETPALDTLRQEKAGLAPEKQCSCGEPHISKRIVHRYDGKPCYVAEKEGEPDIDAIAEQQHEMEQEKLQ